MRWRGSCAHGARRCRARSAASTPTAARCSTRRAAALVAASPAQAFALAGDLAALIDDMIIEGVDWSGLETLVADAIRPLLAHHARLPQDRLRILAAMARRARPRRSRQARRAARRRRNQGARSRRAARPDDHRRLDRRQPRHRPADRRDRARAAGRGRAARSRPGSRRRRLGDDRGDATSDAGRRRPSAGAAAPADRRSSASAATRCERSARPRPALAARAAFLSEALRPAELDRALARSASGRARRAPPIAAPSPASRSIVADNETEEALALAIAMREALETPGRTAALVTPDPSIARRVAAELARWGVEVEDSAGRTLGAERGRRARAARRSRPRATSTPPIVAALLVASGGALRPLGRGESTRAARALELGVFRAVCRSAALDDLDATLRRRARRRRANARASCASGALDEADWRAAAEGLRATSPPRWRRCARSGLARRLRDFARRASRRARRAGCAARTTARRRTGVEALDDLMDEWSEAAGDGFACTPRRIRGAVRRRRWPASARRPARGGHPRLQILGLLEARLLDLRLRAARRPRRDGVAARGRHRRLSQPADARRSSACRRRSGASARPRTISSPRSARPRRSLSRAKKRGGAPTVASRFLQRIGAVAGAMRDGGAAETRGAALSRARPRARPAEPIAPRQRPDAVPAARAAPAPAQRDPDRDPAARPLRDLRRAASCDFSRSRRSARVGAARDRAMLARRAAGLRRDAIPPARCRRRRATRSSAIARSALRAAARRPGLQRAALAAHRRRRSTSSSPSSADAQRRSRASWSSSTARSTFRSTDGSPFTLTRARRPHRTRSRRRRGADRLQDRRAAGRRARSRSASRRS